MLEGAGDETWRCPHFTIEMETGTGKTYVYQRTIFELRQRYGFSKFIIVVPSIAIFQGVLKSFDLTASHFRALYNNELVMPVPYDGSQLTRLRSFATNTFATALVITIDAFKRITNNIYKHSEKLPGERKPYQFIQETRPIVILDEPQNMESERAKAALRTLHPMMVFRYSATHRSSPNLIYTLTPFEAFHRKLVKRIQVMGIYERDNHNQPLLALKSISRNGQITAKVRTLVNDGGQTHEADITLRQKDDLYRKTGRDEFREQYVVEEINAAENFVYFENGRILRLRDATAPSRSEIFRLQIEETVRRHLELQSEFFNKGLQVKVLSLFFIDRVANYMDEDGIVKCLFDAAFEKLKAGHSHFERHRPEQVREAYFAQMRFGRHGASRAIDTGGRNNAERQAEREAFELIMKSKERLLSFGEPVSFIFAHSALREGWDNPNVFQICTLNHAVAEIRKRQEIGRGLRLCVAQNGERIIDDEVNVLTVIANESYHDYAENLQREYREAGVADAPPRVTHAKRAKAIRNDEIFQHNEKFREFWQKLSQQVSYRVHLDTPRLVEACIARLNGCAFPEPVIVIEKGGFVITRFTLRLDAVREHPLLGESELQAQLTVTIEKSSGTPKTTKHDLSRRDRLDRVLRDDRLRGFQVVGIHKSGNRGKIVFANGEELETGASLRFASEAGQRVETTAMQRRVESHPVFNLLDRVARETNLTRPTINRIFKGLKAEHKQMLFRNPEGFAGHFIGEIKQILADHMATRLEFVLEGAVSQQAHELARLFPPEKLYPQVELEAADEYGLYDKIQTDSGVEKQFVEQLKAKRDGMIFYFKFPAAFRIKLPRLIGNYNPDWGIVRYGEDRRVILELVRETKYRCKQELRFPHERRKVDCAHRYFEKLGIDYRAIFPQFAGWWRRE